MSKRIALVIGHNAKAQGAVRVTDGRPEYDWNSDLARAIHACAPALFTIFRRTAGVGEISRCYSQIPSSQFAATMELHFNSAAARSATGTETLNSGTSGSLRLARLVQPAMVGALGLRDRGLVTIKKGSGGRGEGSLWTGAPPAILIEPYFGSNSDDCAAADLHFHALARAITGACMAYLKEL